MGRRESFAQGSTFRRGGSDLAPFSHAACGATSEAARARALRRLSGGVGRLAKFNLCCNPATLHYLEHPRRTGCAPLARAAHLV